MRTDLLDYPLPEAAIAQHPAPRREDARLLVVRRQGVEHHGLLDWVQLVPAGALVVLNDTRVRRARLAARKASGGMVELLFLSERPLSNGAREWIALGHANRPLRAGTVLELGEARLTVLERTAGPELHLEVRGVDDTEAFIERHGALPLPPYIRRSPQAQDAERYQTVFAHHLGSAAAPTAGLHLTQPMLAALEERGVRIAHVTLHVGAGTFLPVRADDLDDHPMHAERYSVSPALVAAIARARARSAPVVAVGTTVVRALESALDPECPGQVVAGSRETRLLIQPGYVFGVVDALLTNFHAPKSTLLALVSAFVGLERCAAAYRAALAAGYRFLSYGDATWLPERCAPEQQGARPDPETASSHAL
ncbi:MAG TPA: tRNA preQ1(34) S-adenosylmethionine ribosyltransferase-isomerase QueA [Polyangiaceae bacterium]|nr:tRNA preQ1(34) S-adenosylmethionine ribosyltransferase-isomerase QueA [Polyangiaceae bacterium]